MGQNKTLKFLNLSNSGIFSRTGLKYLGNAIAFNSQKKGSLKYLLIKKCINRVEDIGIISLSNKNIKNNNFLIKKIIYFLIYFNEN